MLLMGVWVILPAPRIAGLAASAMVFPHARAQIRGLAPHIANPSVRLPVVRVPLNSATHKFLHRATSVGPPSEPRPSLNNAAVSLPLLASRARRNTLDHPRRKRILREIQEHPGIPCTELGRNLGIGKGVLVFHLRCLEKEGLVRHRTLNHGKYFHVPDVREPPSVLSLTTRKRQVLATITTSPALTESQLAKELRLSPRTMGHHLRDLRALGLVLSVHFGHRLVWLAARENRNYSIPDHKSYGPKEAMPPRREEDAPTREEPLLAAPKP